MGNLSEHFDSSEFECGCGCGYGLNPGDVDPELLDLLEQMRECSDFHGDPIYITQNGGCRCQQSNIDAGGVEDSAHMRGMAADIAVDGGYDRWKVLTSAVVCGSHGIGVANGFIHVDVCNVKPRPSAWGYP